MPRKSYAWKCCTGCGADTRDPEGICDGCTPSRRTPRPVKVIRRDGHPPQDLDDEEVLPPSVQDEYHGDHADDV